MAFEQRIEKKKINIEQVVSFLSRSFQNAQQAAARKIGYKNTKGSKLYGYQVEFCYLIDDITRGPRYIAPKRISKANELIAELNEIGGISTD